MELQLFLHNNLAIHFFYSKESLGNNLVTVKNLCVVFSGLPNLIDKKYFESRVNRDTAYLSVYYYGTWLSGGKFTFNNCKKTIKDALQFTKNKTGIRTFDGKKLGWNFKNLNIIGYSFAANPVLTAKVNRKDVKAVFLYSPLIYVNKSDISKILDKDGADKFIALSRFFLKFLQRGYKYALRGISDPSWDKYFSGNELSSQINLFSQYPPIYIYHGLKDSQVNPAFSKYFYSINKNITKLFLIKDRGHDKELFNLSHLI